MAKSLKRWITVVNGQAVCLEFNRVRLMVDIIHGWLGPSSATYQPRPARPGVMDATAAAVVTAAEANLPK